MIVKQSDAQKFGNEDFNIKEYTGSLGKTQVGISLVEIVGTVSERYYKTTTMRYLILE